MRITNTLPDELDFTAKHSVPSSHRHAMSGIGKIIDFVLTNIYLPDCTEDNADSNGFVELKISPNQLLKINGLFSLI